MPGQKPDPRLDPPALTPSSGLAKLGPRALLAASLVHALSKAARAFTLYEPSNALIRQFLAEYRARADAATAGGPLAVDVSPYELRSEGEVVYREEDRERSLAFRLYRDGIRRVTFSPEPPFEELLRFLEILAIRFTGIRQAEDDVVTLLRKAALGAIEVVAVEEYTADEAEPQGRPGHDTRPPLELDPRFDTPAPRLPAPRPIAQREVPEAAVARLRREEDPATVVGSALALAEELLALGTSGALPAEEVTRFCAELRDYLVADGQIAPLAALADLVRVRAGERIRDELMRALADARLLEVVLAAIPPGSGELPAHAARLLPFVPASAVIDRLSAEDGESRRPALVALVAARLPADVGAVLKRLASVPAPVARALAKAVGAKAPAHVAEAAVALLDHRDEALQAEALRAVGALGARVPPARISALLGASSEHVRTAAAAALERHGDAAAARALAEALEGRDMSRGEAAAFGRALGKLKPAVAAKLFEGWLREKRGLFRALRSNDREESRRWAAVAGLGAIGGPEAEQLIEAAAAGGDEELRHHCQATLARRRAESRRG